MPPDRACFGPTFSLYADGTVIFRPAPTDEDAEVGRRRYPSYSVAVLTAAATESLHADAVATLTAVAAKPVPPVDPNAPIGDPAWYDTFTVDLGGRRLVVAPGQGPIPPAHVATPELAPLTRRLEAFAPDRADLASPAGPWAPDRFLASVGFGTGVPTADWPWPNLTPAGFGATPDGSGPATPRLLRPADAEPAGVANAGGLTDLWVRGPDGTGAYLIFLRALMPDESVPAYQDGSGP